MTPVQFDDGQSEELPDAELCVAQADGSFNATWTRLASKWPIPSGKSVHLINNGNGTVTSIGQAPGSPPVTVLNFPIRDGEVVLPDELFFPIRG